MSYKAYMIITGGKKLWINRAFRTKTEAQKELRIAIKDLEPVVRIMDSGIVSDAPAKTKPASKSASRSVAPAPRSRPNIPSGLTVLRFMNEKGTHLVGIAPAQLSVVKQTFTAMKCSYARVVVTSRTMTITAIDDTHVELVKLGVPVYSGSNLRGTIIPDEFGSSSIYVTEDNPFRLAKTFENFDLRKGNKAQASAKALSNMMSPFSTGKQAKLYRVKIEMGATGKAVVLDDENIPVSTAVPLRMVGGKAVKKTACNYAVRYLKGIIKVFGSATIVMSMQKSDYLIAIGGVNKGVKILFILAPLIDNNND